MDPKMKMNIEEIISDCYSEELSLELITSFDEIIKACIINYHERFKGRFDNYLAYYKTVNLEDAIEYSSKGKYKLDGSSEFTWFHQQVFIQHNGEEPLIQLAKKLQSLRVKIVNLKDFDALFQLIKEISSNIDGIGSLSIYDTALRLGSHLNMTPDFIYIHAGTKTGFKALMDEKCDKEYIEMKIFRTIPNLYKLEPIYLEDILCIYKKTFKKLKSPTR